MLQKPHNSGSFTDEKTNDRVLRPAGPKSYREGFPPGFYVLFVLILLAVMCLCISLGSVTFPLKETLLIIRRSVAGQVQDSGTRAAIILQVRIPRVICTALTGASLALCGAAMQGLLKNPLADGSTLGVSSGASLGACLAIVLGGSAKGAGLLGTAGMSMLFAFISLLLILSLAWRLDQSLSTNTIILMGVIFSMFINSIITLLITFSSEKLKTFTFWTMGSLADSSWRKAFLLAGALAAAGCVILLHAGELNAFAAGEENALHIGVNIKRVRLTVLITVSILIGVCVSIGGTIGFVGLVTPHILRMITGPNHRRLLPASLIGGSVFLLLADLLARTILRPLELPVGAVTSFTGALLFVYIFYRRRTGKRADI